MFAKMKILAGVVLSAALLQSVVASPGSSVNDQTTIASAKAAIAIQRGRLNIARLALEAQQESLRESIQRFSNVIEGLDVILSNPLVAHRAWDLERSICSATGEIDCLLFVYASATLLDASGPVGGGSGSDACQKCKEGRDAACRALAHSRDIRIRAEIAASKAMLNALSIRQTSIFRQVDSLGEGLENLEEALGDCDDLKSDDAKSACREAVLRAIDRIKDQIDGLLVELEEIGKQAKKIQDESAARIATIRAEYNEVCGPAVIYKTCENVCAKPAP